MMNRFFLCLGVLFTVISVAAQNQFLDPTFGTNGVFTYTPNNANTFIYETGAITSQQKIIVSGSYYNPPNNNQYPINVIQRLNADGTIDNSFNTVFIPASSTTNSIRMLRMNIQSDQKILLGDIFGRRFIRLNENGTYDTGFGDNGAVNISIFDPYFAPNGISSFKLSNILLTNNNKILLCIKVLKDQQSNYMIARLNENGSIDTTFGNNGLLLQVAENGNLILQNDSKIIFIGQRADEVYTKTRYTENGILDTTYNNSVLPYSPLAGHVDYFFNAVGKDNNTYIYGISPSVSSFTAFITLMKLNQNGEFDTSFGTNGVVHEPYYYNNNNYLVDTNLHYPRLLLDNSNNIFVANMTSTTGNAADMNQYIKKFKSDGSVDNGFGNNGVVEIDLNYREFMGSAILTPDQKILTFGYHQMPSKGIIVKVLNNTSSLSVKSQEIKQDKLSIYPNPVKDILNIKNAKSKDLPIEIIDASGRSILKTIINENKVDISHLEKGIYYLNTVNTTHKFIKE